MMEQHWLELNVLQLANAFHIISKLCLHRGTRAMFYLKLNCISVNDVRTVECSFGLFLYNVSMKSC